VTLAVSALAGTGQIPYTGTGNVTVTAVPAGTGTIPNVGTGDETAPAAALAGSGNLFFTGTGKVTFFVELVGVCTLSDTARQIKHFDGFSNFETYLDLT